MSLALDQVRRIDVQLDKLQWAKHVSAPSSPVLTSPSDETSSSDEIELPDAIRVRELKAAIKLLTTTTNRNSLMSSARIQIALCMPHLFNTSLTGRAQTRIKTVPTEEHDLEWLLVSKAIAQTHGLIIELLLEQTLPLGWDLRYWDEVLSSPIYLGLYSVQTAPRKLWRLCRDIYIDVRRKVRPTERTATSDKTVAVPGPLGWSTFYRLVKTSLRNHSLAGPSSQIVSPLIYYRAEVQFKQQRLKKFRDLSACGLGVLVDEGMNLNGDASEMRRAKIDEHAWKMVVLKSVALMETVLCNLTASDLGYNEYEDLIFTSIEEDTELTHANTFENASEQQLALMINRLQLVLQVHLPNHVAKTKRLVTEFGRPSRIVRYWIPVMTLLLSSSTLLRIVTTRKAQLNTWIRDLGTTSIDFWQNWVVEPVRKVVGTIRHDKDAEIALMSKESLKGDQASLERMVVDFARDNVSSIDGATVDESELAKVRAKVREGDLTPVLRAYEKDLRRPIIGTVRGDLIRALLIQIQKTKVDVEVAVGGIDALLKSQELVFGFVGLTPGVLVCFGIFRWLDGVVGGRKGKRDQKSRGKRTRLLRNIDRILNSSPPSNNGMLSYKDHGMLLCEIHVLRRSARHVMPNDIFSEFLEEINELVDLHTGIERQIRVVDRIRWAYSEWMG